MSNCIQCTAHAVCTLCKDDYYLNTAGDGCVSDCSLDSSHLNDIGTKCVSSCSEKISYDN